MIIFIQDIKALAPVHQLNQVQESISKQGEKQQNSLDELTCKERFDYYSRFLLQNIHSDDLEREIIFIDTQKVNWLEIDPSFLYIDFCFKEEIEDFYLREDVYLREKCSKKTKNRVKSKARINENRRIINRDLIVIYSWVYQVLSIAKERFDGIAININSLFAQPSFFKYKDVACIRSLEEDALFKTLLICATLIKTDNYPVVSTKTKENQTNEAQKFLSQVWRKKKKGHRGPKPVDMTHTFDSFYEIHVVPFIKSNPLYAKHWGVFRLNQKDDLLNLGNRLRGMYNQLRGKNSPHFFRMVSHLKTKKDSIFLNVFKHRECIVRISYKNYILIPLFLSIMLMIILLLTAGKSFLLSIFATTLAGILSFIFFINAFFYTKYSKKKKALSRTYSNPPLPLVCFAQLILSTLLIDYLNGTVLVFEVLSYIFLLWMACVVVSIVIGEIKLHYQTYKKEYVDVMKSHPSYLYKNANRRMKLQLGYFVINRLFFVFKKRSKDWGKKYWKTVTMKWSVLTILAFIVLCAFYGLSFMPVPVQYISLLLLHCIRGVLMSLPIVTLFFIILFIMGFKLYGSYLKWRGKKSQFMTFNAMNCSEKIAILGRNSDREQKFWLRCIWLFSAVWGGVLVLGLLVYLFILCMVGVNDAVNTFYAVLSLSLTLLIWIKVLLVCSGRVLYKSIRYRKLYRLESLVLVSFIVATILSIVISCILNAYIPATYIMTETLKRASVYEAGVLIDSVLLISLEIICVAIGAVIYFCYYEPLGRNARNQLFQKQEEKKGQKEKQKKVQNGVIIQKTPQTIERLDKTQSRRYEKEKTVKQKKLCKHSLKRNQILPILHEVETRLESCNIWAYSQSCRRSA